MRKGNDSIKQIPVEEGEPFPQGILNDRFNAEM